MMIALQDGGMPRRRCHLAHTRILVYSYVLRDASNNDRISGFSSPSASNVACLPYMRCRVSESYRSGYPWT